MKYDEKIVAFIDILGFKNLVGDDSKCEEVGAILKLPYLMRQGDMANLLKIKGVMMTSISDSLVFSIGLKERSAMNKITKLLSVFTQILLSDHRLLLRGGITVGNLYHDNDIVFGPGLVKVYEIESKIAIFPRIIISPEDFERSILSCSRISKLELRRNYILSNDCFLMLDCFRYANQNKIELCQSMLTQIKTSDIRAQQKINWMSTTLDRKTNRNTL